MDSQKDIEETKLAQEKELFLRTKIYDLYIFLAKLIISLSTAAIVFSVAMFNYENFNKDPNIFLYCGWILLFLAIISIFLVIRNGIILYYDFLDNFKIKGSEISEKTIFTEIRIEFLIQYSFFCSTVGVAFILYYLIF